jgi:hypothetical protein
VNGAVAAIRDSVAANGYTAYYSAAGADLTLEDSAAVNNDNMGAYANLATVRLSNTIITNNLTGVRTGDGWVYSFGNNDHRKRQWHIRPWQQDLLRQ